jgi:hypothetical protein
MEFALMSAHLAHTLLLIKHASHVEMVTTSMELLASNYAQLDKSLILLITNVFAQSELTGQEVHV